MCGKNSGVKTPADWKGKNVGVTDIGSGTDNLTEYLAARYHLTTKDYTRVGVGAGTDARRRPAEQPDRLRHDHAADRRTRSRSRGSAPR